MSPQNSYNIDQKKKECDLEQNNLDNLLGRHKNNGRLKYCVLQNYFDIVFVVYFRSILVYIMIDVYSYIFFNLFSGKNIFKAYKLLIINTKNMNFAYLCCISLNSVTMPSKLLPISTEHGRWVYK